MITKGKKCKPVNAVIRGNGKYTVFSVPQNHLENNGYVRDGFIQIMANGAYDFTKGDTLLVKDITGAGLRSYGDRSYFTIYAEIEYFSHEKMLAGDNLKTLEDDIPDDLF